MCAATLDKCVMWRCTLEVYSLGDNSSGTGESWVQVCVFTPLHTRAQHCSALTFLNHFNRNLDVSDTATVFLCESL